MYHLGLVALGGAFGAACRHLVNLVALRWFGPTIPVGTLAVNVLGGLLMGVLAGALASQAEGARQGLRLFLATGVLGGFTTFSAFSLDAVLLWQRGEAAGAFAYVLASVALSIAALVAGLAAVRVLA
jgi:CrcB protein